MSNGSEDKVANLRNIGTSTSPLMVPRMRAEGGHLIAMQRGILSLLAKSSSGELDDKDFYLPAQANNQVFLFRGLDIGRLTQPPVIDPVPLTEPWLRGIANIQGEVYAIVDLSMFFGGQPVAATLKSRMVCLPGAVTILVESTRRMALEDEVMAAPAGAAPPRECPWLKPAGLAGVDQATFIVDVQAMLAAPEFTNASRVTGSHLTTLMLGQSSQGVSLVASLP